MNIEQLREHCIAKPNVTESLPFDNDTLSAIAQCKMQNANWKMQNRTNLSERLLDFAASSIKMS
jgi:hypothetical protein